MTAASSPLAGSGVPTARDSDADGARIGSPGGGTRC